MARTLLKLLIIGSVFLVSKVPLTPAQTPDGTVKINSRMVAPGIGLSWGEGVLTYEGRDHPFTFKATGLFRDVDPAITAAELSGQVFNLKNPADFGGQYQKIESEASPGGSGTRATIRNQNGVVVNLASTVAGRKFNFSRDGMEIELKKPTP
jgi:outer membrane immunogenic protein